MVKLDEHTTIADIEASHFDPIDIQIDAVLSNYNPVIKKNVQDKKVAKTIDGINKLHNDTYVLNGKNVSAYDYYSHILKEQSKLFEQYYDYENKKFKDDTPQEVIDRINNYEKFIRDKKVQDDVAKEDIIKRAEENEKLVADRFAKFPKHLATLTVGGIWGAAEDASDDSILGIGRQLNKLTDKIVPDSIPYLGEFTKYNKEEWDNFSNYLNNTKNNYLDLISPTKENRKEYERSYNLGRLLAPLSPNAKLRSGAQAIKGITNPKLLKTANYALNGTGLALGSTTPGMDFDGISNYLWQLPIGLGMYETNSYLENKLGIANDYTKPEDRLSVSVLFNNVGNHNKDKHFTKAITKKGEALYSYFVMNELEKNRNAYDEAKQSFRDSLLGTTATVSTLLLNKKYDIKGKAFRLWQKGKNKSLDKLNSKYKKNIYANKYVNFEKIDRLYDSLTPSMKLRSTMIDKYAILDEMIDRKLLNRYDLPFFYNDKSVIKDSMYETGIISKSIKLKVAPKVTDSLIMQLKDGNPALYNEFDQFLNEYTKLNFAKRNGADIKSIVNNSDKYKNFKYSYKKFKETPITREIMEQISEQNKAIQKMFSNSNIDNYVDNNKLSLDKDLLYAYDEESIIDKIFREKKQTEIAPQFFKDNNDYKPLHEVHKSRLYNAADKYIKNEQKKQFINARNKNLRLFLKTKKRNVSSYALNFNSEYKKLGKVTNSTEQSMDKLILNLQEDFAKQYNVRFMGEIDINEPTKVIKSKSDIEFIDKFDKIIADNEWMKNKYIKGLVDLEDVFEPSTNKALNFILKEGKNNPNNILTIVEGDKIKVYRTDEMIGAMFNHNPDTPNLVQRANRTLKKMQEKMTTGRLNPLFSVKSNIYTIQEGATAMTKIVDEVAHDLGLDNFIRRFENINDIKKAGFKSIKDDPNVIISDELITDKPPYEERLKEQINQLGISVKDYIKETFKASKELMNQRKAANLVNNQARLLGKTLLNGDVNSVPEIKHELANLQKQYNDFLSTRIQLSGYASKSPYTQIDDNLVDVSNINLRGMKNIPKTTANYVDFIQTVIRESPVLGLTTYLGKKLGYIGKNGKIIDKERMEVLSKSIAKNTANSNVKGNYLKTSGKLAKFIAKDMNYGEVYLKSIGAKAHAMGIGKFVDNVIEDGKLLLDKSTSYGEFFDIVGKQLSTLKDNKGLKTALGTWGLIGLSNYVWNHASAENTRAYYSIPEYERTNNIILVNALGNGKHLKLPIDQEYGIILNWSHLVADNTLNFSELNDVDPTFEQANQLRQSLGRSLFPGGIPLFDTGIALSGYKSDINLLSNFGGLRNLAKDNVNVEGGDTRYTGGVMSAYTQNVIETIFANYGSIFVSTVEEGNASLKSNSAIKDVGKVLVDKYTTPVNFTTSKISRYTQTNNYNYEYSNTIENNSKVKAEMNEYQAFAHEFVTSFKRNRINKLEEIRDAANYEKKKQIANGNKEIFLDYEGRRVKINQIDDFINRINKRIYREYQILDNSLSYTMEDNYGLTGVNVLNYKDKLGGL